VWRNIAVNHSFTFDKLYASEITAASLADFDVLVVNIPRVNYTAAERSVITNWVQNGGGLFVLGDWVYPGGLENLNQLTSGWGLKLDYDVADMGTFSTTELVDHPILDYMHSVGIDGGKWLNLSGDAYPIVEYSGNISIAGADPGVGRVILSGDINFLDRSHIQDDDNFQFAINVFNWLSSAAAHVLLYNDEFLKLNPYDVAPARALENLGIKYFLTRSIKYFNFSLHEYWDQWSLVVFDQPGGIADSYLDDMQAWVESGGKMIVSMYWMTNLADHPLWPLFGFIPLTTVPNQSDVHIWSSDNPIFNLPADYAATLFRPNVDYGIEGVTLHVFDNATSLAGLTASEQENKSVIVTRNDGQTLFNSFLIDEFQADYDNSTYMESLELWVNEIGYMYYDRPTINHPDDVTYITGETGNEIVWTPSASAGAWEYVLRINGSIAESGSWSGGALTFNVDGYNASVTEYELTVYDVLGYSVSDTVLVNVTVEAPPILDGFDPTLLIVGGAIAAVLIIVVLYMKKMKKS